MLVGGVGVLSFCWSVARLILGQLPRWAWKTGALGNAFWERIGQSVGFACCGSAGAASGH